MTPHRAVFRSWEWRVWPKYHTHVLSGSLGVVCPLWCRVQPPESRFSQVSEFWKLRIRKRSPCAKEGNLMFSRAAPSNKASNRPSNEAVNYLHCGQSELRCTVSIKCILDFKDLVWKRVITFYVDYAGEIVIFWSNWVKENILLKSVSCKLLCIEWIRSYWVAQDTVLNNLYKPRWKYEKEYIYNWITLMHSKN